MIRRLVLTAGLTVLGAIALAPKAYAQVAAPAANEMVKFEGAVGSVCKFSGTKPGELYQVDPVTLDSDVPEGKSGGITVNCTGENQISVAAPMPVKVPTGFTADALLDAKISDGTNQTYAVDGPTTPLNVTPAVDVPLTVDMVVESTNPLPPGVYQYDVMLTATPN